MEGISVAAFGIHLLLCNLFLCPITGAFLAAKRLLRDHLTARMQFHLWFPFLGLLTVPFLSIRPALFSQVFPWFDRLKSAVSTHMEPAAGTTTASHMPAAGQINDFALSVSGKTPSTVGFLLSALWLCGILAMLFFMVRSRSRLNALQRSALPLQNEDVRMLYDSCLKELHIKRDIPIYSTAFLKSPVIAGMFRPRIYLPIHLLSAPCPGDIRYILLHELQHYRHKDALAGFLMNLFGILYWFNPLVWYALKEMRIDREIACDAAVLQSLDESDYRAYGSTLINFAEKISLTPFPFGTGISGDMRQMQKRILHIASYRKPSARQRAGGAAAFTAIAGMFFALAPALSIRAADGDDYPWNISAGKVSAVDLSARWEGFEGSFVLYSPEDDTWSVYHMDHAVSRISPDSTYKIYSALFALEEGIIAPDDSFMAWDGTDYPFEEWNADQDLYSAMRSSVNWYFQETDRRLGASVVGDYMKKIGYGNKNTGTDLSSCWMQSTLKISPVEQVVLLTDLYNNSFGFLPENIDTVKDSIRLFSSEDCVFYGKTGTGRVDGRDISGSFVGFVETGDRTYFFAANIQGGADASGGRAMEITEAVLSDLNIL